ncbi:MAG TPA: hypothetical protein VJ911_09735 [Cryomorphaceae bacterium]|nr:hypothetical protein [Cryomorphaceae bacterium]
MMYRSLIGFFFLSLGFTTAQAQEDIIEREYFPNARAKNASIAAARYAEEGYYYTKFTTYISAVDSSRMFADTALFFVKRSLMLSDTALVHAPISNYPARDFLQTGRSKLLTADTVIREYYPMREIRSHHVFGTDASLTLSNAVMDFFNASLLLKGEQDAPEAEEQRYKVLPFNDEVIRLEADESAYQSAANAYEKEIAEFEEIMKRYEAQVASASSQKKRFAYRERKRETELQIDESTSRLRDATSRIEEIRQILDQKYLADVEGVEPPSEHVAQFETGENPEEIEMDEVIPDGLVYKIQLGYYPSDVDVSNFRGLYPISGETVNKELVRIYAGVFFSYAEASKGNEYIRSNAIANAFVVPFYNGSKVSVSKAVEVERRRGVK